MALGRHYQCFETPKHIHHMNQISPEWMTIQTKCIIWTVFKPMKCSSQISANECVCHMSSSTSRRTLLYWTVCTVWQLCLVWSSSMLSQTQYNTFQTMCFQYEHYEMCLHNEHSIVSDQQHSLPLCVNCVSSWADSSSMGKEVGGSKCDLVKALSARELKH